MLIAVPPLSSIAETTDSQAVALRLDTTTLAPACARAMAMARPMPRDEPVTTAIRPVRSKSVMVGSLLRGSDDPGAFMPSRSNQLNTIRGGVRGVFQAGRRPGALGRFCPLPSGSLCRRRLAPPRGCPRTILLIQIYQL